MFKPGYSIANVEYVILAGGSSRRMGTDKSNLQVDGVAQIDRMVKPLRKLNFPVTVLGPGGTPDSEPGAGPLAALADFEPSKKFVLVASCDIPLFDLRIVGILLNRIEDNDAAIPTYKERLQPLCALYTADAIRKTKELRAAGETRIMGWIDKLTVATVTEAEIEGTGLNSNCIRGANTPEEWEELSKL